MRFSFLAPRLTLVAALCLGLTAPSLANDLTFGGDARAFAMGGAGVASLAGSSGNSLGARANPASLAFARGAMKFHFPTVGARADGGITVGKAFDYLSTNGSGASATSLARDFASRDSSFGLNGSLGLRIGPIEVLGTAVGKGYLLPNAALKTWGQAGGTGSVPTDSRADVIGAAVYSLPQIGIAARLPETSEDRPFNVAVGARLKYMNAVYAHYFADKSILDSGGAALRAPEMGGKDTLTKKGFGADLGVMLESRQLQGLSAGLVVANLIKPKFQFTGEFGANANGGGGTRVYDLLATTASAGVGFQRGTTTLVADLVDITSAAGTAQLRAGVEQRLGPVALRAGYNSANGYTYGVGLFGFDIALGNRQPLEVVRTLRF